MTRTGWKIIEPHRQPAAKTVNTVSFTRSETRLREGAECRESPRLPAGGEVCLLTFLFIEPLTNPWGTPKTTEVVEDLAFCGSDCGSGFSAFLRFLVGERVALLAAIEPRATCPERRLFGQVENNPPEIGKHCGAFGGVIQMTASKRLLISALV
jgi:hypothetical protein